MTRFKAAGIHLLLSAVIVAIVLCVMWFIWYPKGFFKLLGGSDLLLIISGVDICLGPLLTLAVYNEKKKSLKLDLAIIGVLQICALLYGTNVMFNARPVFNVFTIDRFVVTLASDLKGDPELEKASKRKWQTLPIAGPLIVGAESPKDPVLKKEITFAAAAGKDWNMFPKLYVEYDEQRTSVLKKAKTLKEVSQFTAKNKKIVDQFLLKNGSPEDSFVAVPILSGLTSMAAILDARNADFIEIIEADIL